VSDDYIAAKKARGRRSTGNNSVEVGVQGRSQNKGVHGKTAFEVISYAKGEDAGGG